MSDKFRKYIISPKATCFEALKKIDANKKGFVLVCDEDSKGPRFMGTLTDGDIRRGLIAGLDISSLVEDIYKKGSVTADPHRGLPAVIEVFKDGKINFLPVVKDGYLVNIITKKQLHSLLLLNMQAGLDYDFDSLDENLQDYEIFSRPWGFYKTTVMNEYFQSKIISVSPGQALSLQSHNHREEYWIVAHGTGVVQIGRSVINVSRGSSLFIPKETKHRATNTSETENLIITEVQIGDYFGEDDIIRYEDRYNRI